MMKKIKFLLFFLCIALVFGCLAACGSAKTSTPGTDYAKQENWAFYSESTEHDVDVFFVAPTAVHSQTYYMDIADAKAKEKFAGATAMEKGIYDQAADFYAPYYRQMSLEAYALPDDEKAQYQEMAYADVNDAFNYYMEHINQGRPYILAGFSQGSEMVKRLLMENDHVNEKMIAAYVLGWYFEESDQLKYPNIKMAQTEDDLGVVVSWCSEAPDYDEYNTVVPVKTMGINPLSWKTDTAIVSKEANKGACFPDTTGAILQEIPQLCGAYLDPERGTLKVLDVTPDQYPARLDLFNDGNYHIYDYQFFYRNLQENVKVRIDAYLNQK